METGDGNRRSFLGADLLFRFFGYPYVLFDLGGSPFDFITGAKSGAKITPEIFISIFQ